MMYSYRCTKVTPESETDMPPLPTIANTFRVTFNWGSAHGVTPRNVIHVRAALLDEQGVADALAASFNDDMWILVQQDYAFSSIDVLKLDGTSATQTIAIAAQGSLTSGDSIPEGSGIVSLRTAQRGARGRGRVYLGPIAESKQAQGVVVSPNTTSTAWETFRDDLEGEGAALVVASYVHADANDVTNIICDPIIGTQRRRLLQLR